MEERTRLSVRAQGHKGGSPWLQQQTQMLRTLLQNAARSSIHSDLSLQLLIKVYFQGWGANHWNNEFMGNSSRETHRLYWLEDILCHLMLSLRQLQKCLLILPSCSSFENLGVGLRNRTFIHSYSWLTYFLYSLSFQSSQLLTLWKSAQHLYSLLRPLLAYTLIIKICVISTYLGSSLWTQLKFPAPTVQSLNHYSTQVWITSSMYFIRQKSGICPIG